MNILIAGGAGTFVNNLLIKLNKEGHKVSVLSGSRFSKKEDYRKHFELYKFPYDANCLNEIFESAAPDVTIFSGAFDSNFMWQNEESDSVRYTASLANILTAYAMYGKGRFIYFSSNQVFGEDTSEDIRETDNTTVSGFKAQALFQGETMCSNYAKNRELDIVTVRFDSMYCIPGCRQDIKDTVTKMCLEALEEKTIHYSKDATFSPLYENDAVEAFYRLIVCSSHKNSLYHISASTPITEEELANLVRDNIDNECDLVSNHDNSKFRNVLSNSLYTEEFGTVNYNAISAIVKKIATLMKKKSYVFLSDEDENLPLGQRLKKKLGWFIKVIIPFIENLIVFVLCFIFYNKAASSNYFARLDLYLLYVLLFAIIFGQQQATFSALLAVVGFYLGNIQDRTAFEVLLDANTYVWIAQIFIVGLSVGYLRDQILTMQTESEEEKDYLKQQIEDIAVINSANVRVKDILETQVINQSDSVGKIYSITSQLDEVSPEEVLFNAAETVSQVMKTNDVAIYQVSNSDYARLFSATSPKARSLGNSIRYSEMEDVYQTLASGRVYINRNMDSRYPLMANAIFENSEMRLIVMLWGLSWENMTLGEADRLVVLSSLIQNAVLRANRYLAALEDTRYETGTRMLETESFKTLYEAFVKAENRNLTNCAVIRIPLDDLDKNKVIAFVEKTLRDTDYLGKLDDNAIYTLLSNTTENDAEIVKKRFTDVGLSATILEDRKVCH